MRRRPTSPARTTSKIGYDGAIIAQALYNQANDPRMTYNYTQPSVNVCNPFVNPALTACGNTHLGNQFVGPQFNTLEEQRNYFRRPRPASVVINTGDGTGGRAPQHPRLLRAGPVDVQAAHAERRAALRPRDQPLRLDLRRSGRVRARGPGLLHREHDGVSFNDVSPRWGAVYDLFGNGRTAIKFNYGKYLGQAALSGVYAAANPARRTVNAVTVNWDDLNGNRIVDCNIWAC